MAANRPVSASVIAALLMSSAITPLPLQAQQMSRSESGFCRTPSALPQLGAEIDQPRIAQPRSRIDRVEVPPGVVSPAYEDVPTDVAPPPPPPPPSPPPAPIASSPVTSASGRVRAETVDSSVAVEGRRAAPASSTAATSPPAILPPRQQPYPQAGQLTAGEHDDLLNPLLYARYVNRSGLAQNIDGLPQLDTDRTLTVRVTDSAGRPVPMANVVVACSDGNTLNLRTLADGTAVFFPGLDRLSPTVRVSASAPGVTIGAPVTVDVRNQSGGQTVNLVSRRAATAVRALDLALVIDTTGSMGDELRYLQSELASIVGGLRAQHPGVSIRVAFVFYRDTGDQYVTRTVRFDGDIGRAQSALMAQSAGGGGDYPEALDQALIRGVGLDWRPDAVHSMLLVADAPPHDENVARTWHAAEVARQRRIQIVPVAASGVADRAEYAMRAMAALTQSRYLFLTDDSGIGNPHAPPAIDCYLVTRLDGLIRRVIDSQISGRRVEPQSNEVIRTVGNYDNGRCSLPTDFGKDEPQQ